ncbi:hypothetical protein C2G38_2232372 [Gigaspora rosea]|uniref:MULE transposase domain-containing protein n=1 Tax=Gigaspora rosea TaxID=44941 RepID=A0A397TS03_9GLOM|nr:hypothetical protein C2G38_2232372 [Gigaspora rosea]
MSGSEDFELFNSGSEDFALPSVGSGLFSLINLDLYSSVSLELPEYSSLRLVAFASSINSRPLGTLKIESDDTLPSAIRSELNLSNIGSSCSKDIPTDIPPSSLSSTFQDDSPGSTSSTFQDNSSGSMSYWSVSKDISPDVMSSGFKDIAPRDPFDNWDAVQCEVDIYSKQHDFVAIKLRKDLDAVDKTIIRHYDYTCWKSGKRVNSITITNIVDEHNYLCNSKTIELAPKYLRFLQAILNRIENYTIVGQLSASQQYDLLAKKFSDQHIKKKMYVAIGKFRGIRIHDKFDAATMLLYLMNQKDQDRDYVVIPRIEGNFNELTGIFWMNSEQLLVQALTKYETQADYKWILYCTLESTNNLSPTVLFTNGDPAMSAAVHISNLHGNMVIDFISDFYHMRNSSSKENFELRYNDMITKYKACRSYLESKLYPCHESWAKYMIAKIFIAGVESTQRVESINGILKKHLNRGTLLKELVVAVEQELEKESFYTRIRDYYGSNPSSGFLSVYNTIFKDIDSMLKYANLTNKFEESDAETCDMIEHIYDVPQI